MGLDGGSFGRWSDHEDGVLANRIGGLMKEARKRSLAPFPTF